MIIYFLTIFFMAELIVLDYSDAIGHLYHDAERLGDIEEFLYERNDYKESEIEWMYSEHLEIIHHEPPLGATFHIDASEISDMGVGDISDEDMQKILSYIENDEGVWEAIEHAKISALREVLTTGYP